MKHKPYQPLPIVRRGSRLFFASTIPLVSYQEKKFSDYAQFFPNAAAPKNKTATLYRIYRNACAKGDCLRFTEHNLRYDLTILLPQALQSSYPTRTIGHRHRNKAGTRAAYAEIYEVMEGKALFVMENASHTAVYCAQRNAGEKIIIPPRDGHITVNLSRRQPLVVANIFTATPNVADYSFFQHAAGPAWEPRRRPGSESITMRKNPRAKREARCYSVIPALPRNIDKKDKTLYQIFLANPAAFDFLVNPEHHKPLLTDRALFSSKKNMP